LSASSTAYSLAVGSKGRTATVFTIVKDDQGNVDRECTMPGTGRCGKAGTW
jgi:hypothetical protein